MKDSQLLEWQNKIGQDYYQGMQMWEQLSLIAHTAGAIEVLVTHLHSLNLHFLAFFF